jgi:hypothetical protein
VKKNKGKQRMTARQISKASRPGKQVAFVDVESMPPLPDWPQSKAVSRTDEEKELLRLERARKRKNMSEKREEEEKAATLQRLLRKQASKKKGQRSSGAAAGDYDGKDADGSGDRQQQQENYSDIRYIQKPKSSTLSFPKTFSDLIPSSSSPTKAYLNPFVNYLQ